MPPHTLRLLLDARAARRGDAEGLARRQRDQLADMVVHARTASPYCRRHYQGLPATITDPQLLPITTKAELMAHFDEWVTDPAVTLADVEAFVADPALIGHQLAGRYTVATTSGTTGVRGLFLVDSTSMAVTSAMAVRMLTDWLSAADLARLLTRGGRLAIVAATGGHFASGAAAASLRRGRAASRVGAFSVQDPLPQLVAQLNAFDPVVLAPYAATECPFLSYSCQYNWSHVNSDWVLLEPVDADYQPVADGQPSHTVLVSNLANRIQPILRYDLGDSVLVRPDPCPCGNPLPAIRVQGRTADLLTFARPDGTAATLTSLTLSSVLDRIPGIQQSQIVQTGPTSLTLRLRPAPGTDPASAGQAAHEQITHVLTDHGLGHVRLTLDPEPPHLTAGGKLRVVIPWKPS